MALSSSRPQPRIEHTRVQLSVDLLTLFQFNEDLFEYAASVFSGAKRDRFP